MIETSILITGLTQVFKKAGLPTKFLPLMAVIIGALIIGAQNSFMLQSIAEGALIGMATTGVINRVDDVMQK